MSVESLPDKVIALHRSLGRRKVPHAFGGALALGYCTADPRGTHDIDINIFAGAAEVEDVFAALPAGVVRRDRDVLKARRDEQVRLWWAETPVDLFFAYHEFHDYVRSDTRTVRFARTSIPVLGGTSLVIFKAVFDRPKDWIDVDAVAAVGGADFGAAAAWAGRLLGDHDRRARRLAALAA